MATITTWWCCEHNPRRDHDFGKQEQVKIILEVVDSHQRKLCEECKLLAPLLYGEIAEATGGLVRTPVAGNPNVAST